MIKVFLRKDESSHDYVVPEHAIEAFDALDTKIEESQEHSPEWYNLIDEFINNFEQYRMRPSEIDLYVDETVDIEFKPQ